MFSEDPLLNAQHILLFVVYLFGVLIFGSVAFVANIGAALSIHVSMVRNIGFTTWADPVDAVLGVGVLLIVVAIGVGFAIVAAEVSSWAFDRIYAGTYNVEFFDGDGVVGIGGLLGSVVLTGVWLVPIWGDTFPDLAVQAFELMPVGTQGNPVTYVGSVIPLAGLFAGYLMSPLPIGEDQGGAQTTIDGTAEQMGEHSTAASDSGIAEETSRAPDEGASAPRSGSDRSVTQQNSERDDRGDQHDHNTETDTGGEGMDSSSGDSNRLEGRPQYDWQKTTDVSMDDVGGFDGVKNIIERDIIAPMKNSGSRRRAEQFDIPLPNVLLHGPPGTGKTHLAKAIATEIGYPFVKLTGSDVTSKWINHSSELISRLFDEAGFIAEHHGGAVIFVDELDAVAPNRDDELHSENRKVVDEFLNHLGDLPRTVLFIGATNQADQLDSAITRSGRIDRMIEIGVPDTAAREAILRTQLQDRPHNLNESDIAWLAEQTGASDQTEPLVAADLRALVDQAARQAAFEREADQIELADCRKSLEQLRG